MNSDLEQQIGRAIFREAADVFVLVRPGDLRVLEVNPAAQGLTGRRRKDLLGVPLAEIVAAECPAAWEQLVRACKTASPLPARGGYRLRGGAGVPVHITVSRVHAEAEPLALLVIRDVSALERAERRDRGRREVLERIASGQPLPAVLEVIVAFIEREAPGARGSILLLDDDGRRLLHGAAPGLPDTYNRAIHGIEIGPAVGSCGAAAFLRQRVVVEDVAAHPNWAPYLDLARLAGARSCWSEPILSAAGVVLGTFALYRPEPHTPGPDELDAVALSTHLASVAIGRARAEAALRDSQAMLRMVLDNIPQGVFWKDRDSRYLGCNRVVARAMGFATPQDLVGLFDHEFTRLTPEQADFFVAKDRAVMAADAPEYGIIEPATLADGSTIWMETNKLPMHDAAGNVVGVLGTWQDVTARQRAEVALRDSENRLRTILNAEPECVKLLAADGTLLDMNPAGLAMIEAETAAEVLGHCVYSLVAPPDRDAFRELTEGVFLGRSGMLEFDLVGLKGRGRRLEMHAAPLRDAAGHVVAALSVTRDVTERRRLEAQLQHAQKLESLGVLAGGIAHDFNNLLTGILGYADLALHELPEGAPARDYIVGAVNGARRAAELTTQMLAYSGKGRFIVEPVNLSALTEDMARLLEVSISKRCHMSFDLRPDLPAVEADATQVRQVVMNLIINASEAVGERGGVMTVRTGVRDCDRVYLAGSCLDDNLPAGRYVYLEVADTGCGMTAETRAKIFDPFFTTKFTGRGLGLSAVLGIVRGHRGAIRCASAPGRGTTFEVLFPAGRAAARGQGEKAPVDWRGGGAVLVVDDEPTVRELARRMLEALGFTVLTAGDGREAVEVFRDHGGCVRLVLLDMTMPHMDGEETLRELRQLRGDVRVLLTSGYSEPTQDGGVAATGAAGFIQKPYRLDELQAAVRGALEGDGR